MSAKDYVKEGVSTVSGIFTTIFGMDLILETQIAESVLGSGDLSAVVGLILFTLGSVTLYKIGEELFL